MRLIRTTILAALLGAATTPALAQDAFTYQGSLQSAGQPYTGTADYLFSLWDAPAGGNQLGVTADVSGLQVDGGLFSTELDFGAEAHGPGRYLQIEVRTPAWDGLGAEPPFFTFPDRTAMTAAPYSLSTRGITVDADGRVGIGTDTPNARLEVDDSMRVYAYDAPKFHIGNRFGDATFAWENSVGRLKLETSNQRAALFSSYKTHLGPWVSEAGNTAQLEVHGGVTAESGPPGITYQDDHGYGFSGDQRTGLFSLSNDSVSIYTTNIERFRFHAGGITFPNGTVQATAVTAPYSKTVTVSSFTVPSNGQFTHATGIGDNRFQPGMAVIVTPVTYSLWDFHSIGYARVSAQGVVEWRIVSNNNSSRTYSAAAWRFTAIP